MMVEAPNLIINADRRRLKQMLVNLLSNAVKFTGEGGRLGIDVTTDAAAGVMHFVVWDTGIGIAAEDIPQLFHPFVQLDSSLARQYAGTGLGLALVQRMAALHGGAVSIESTVGVGSRFTIILPWTPPAHPLAALPPTADATIVHETLQTSRLRLLARLLRRFGAIPLPRALAAQTFDQIALMQPEIVMLGASDPDAAGAPLWRALQTDPRTQSIHLLVADLADSSPLVDSSLVHPLPRFFTVGDLSDTFRQTGLHGSRPRVVIIGAPTLRPRVLVTEDSEATQQLLQDFLASLDYEVMLAADGAAAITLTATARPDIVLMDVQMPGIDGLEATRRIRVLANLQARQTPIIAVTALAMPGDAERCLAAGVNSYLAKPFALPDVVQKIEEWLVVRSAGE
jgi:CheY-like chemotaxis protein/anti-sigma regulatory factor (Ser/Thr protein kinase)